MTIPNSVTNVGRAAFPDNIKEIYYGGSEDEWYKIFTPYDFRDPIIHFNSPTTGAYGDLTYINYNDHIEITDCEYSAKTIDIPKKIKNLPVTSIGTLAFFNCIGLKSVTIPDSVTIIDYMAFIHCDSLTDVYYSGSKEQWNNITVESSNDDLTNANIHYSYAGETQPAPTSIPTTPIPTAIVTAAPETPTPSVNPEMPSLSPSPSPSSTADPETPSPSKMPSHTSKSVINVENDKISVSTRLDDLTHEDKHRSKVYAVLYNKNDVVVDVYAAVYDGSNIESELKNSNEADHIKVFVWSKDGSLEPITDTAEYISL